MCARGELLEVINFCVGLDVVYAYFSTSINTARHLNKVEAVQHVHLTNIPVWFGLLGDI